MAAAGSGFSAVVTVEGHCFLWGSNEFGRLGLDEEAACASQQLDTESQRDEALPHPPIFAPTLLNPVFVNLRVVVQASCGFSHTALVTEEGCVYTWGSGTLGKLGHGDCKDRLQPQEVHLPVQGCRVTLVACTQSKTLATTSEFHLLSTGGKSAKTSRIITSMQPVPIAWAETVANLPYGVAGGDLVKVNHVYGSSTGNHQGILSMGRAFLWGDGSCGQLGLGDWLDRSTPELVSQIDGTVAEIACGRDHTAVLLQNGSLYTMGDGSRGQLGTGTFVSKRWPTAVPVSGCVASIATGDGFTCFSTDEGCCVFFIGTAPVDIGVAVDGPIAVEEPTAVQQRLALPQHMSIKSMDAGDKHVVVTTSSGKVMACSVASQTAADGVIQLQPVPTLEDLKCMTASHADSSRLLAEKHGITVAQLYTVQDLKVKDTMLKYDNTIIMKIEAVGIECDERVAALTEEKTAVLAVRNVKRAAEISNQMRIAKAERKSQEDELSQQLCSPTLIKAWAEQVNARHHASALERVEEEAQRNNRILTMQLEARKHRFRVAGNAVRMMVALRGPQKKSETVKYDPRDALFSVLQAQKVSVQEKKDSVCHDLDVAVEGLLLSQQYDRVDRASTFLVGMRKELGIKEAVDDPSTSWKPSSVGLAASSPAVMSVPATPQVTDDDDDADSSPSSSALPTERSAPRSDVASQVEVLSSQMKEMAGAMNLLLERLAATEQPVV